MDFILYHRTFYKLSFSPYIKFSDLRCDTTGMFNIVITSILESLIFVLNKYHMLIGSKNNMIYSFQLDDMEILK